MCFVYAVHFSLVIYSILFDDHCGHNVVFVCRNLRPRSHGSIINVFSTNKSIWAAIRWHNIRIQCLPGTRCPTTEHREIECRPDQSTITRGYNLAQNGTACVPQRYGSEGRKKMCPPSIDFNYSKNSTLPKFNGY